jgi:hypothetical protein
MKRPVAKGRFCFLTVDLMRRIGYADKQFPHGKEGYQ